MRKLLFLWLFMLAGAAFAMRPLPPQGFNAELQGYVPPAMKLDDKLYRTAPALQVRGTNNLLLMPGHVPVNVPVWVQLEPNTGYVWRIWVLKPEELVEMKAKGMLTTPLPEPKPLPGTLPTPQPTPVVTPVATPSLEAQQ